MCTLEKNETTDHRATRRRKRWSTLRSDMAVEERAAREQLSRRQHRMLPISVSCQSDSRWQNCPLSNLSSTVHDIPYISSIA